MRSESTTSQAVENFEINAIGPMRLFQAAWPLLSRAKTPRFLVMSSVFGSIGIQDQLRLPNVVYGMSKAGVNLFVRKCHFEYEKEGLVAVALHPGWVQTDLGNGTATKLGFGDGNAPTTIEDSVKGIMEQVEKSIQEESFGKFIDYDGQPIPW